MSSRAGNNAQVRSPTLNRHSPEVVAEDTRRVLADPATVRAFAQMEAEIVDQIAVAPNGTPEMEEMERELCRTLRTLRRLKGGMNVIPQMDDLRAAGFRSQDPDEDGNDKKKPEPYQPGFKT